MKKVGKTILIVVGALLAMGALGTLFVNLYVESAGPHARIERKLGEALRMPLQFKRATFTPWRGLKIAGITVPQVEPAGTGGNFLDAPTLQATLRLGGLFRRKVVIKKITVTEPKVLWFQNGQGKWLLPFEAKENPQPEHEPAVSEKLPQRPGARGFEVILSELQIRHGSFVFLDRKQKPIASFEDVNAQCPGANSERVQGTATSRKVSIQNAVFAQNLQTSFHYSSRGGELSLPDLRAAIAEGKIGGSFSMKTDESDSPYLGHAKFDGVDLNRLIVEAGGMDYQATGTLRGFLDVAGHTRDSKSATGKGELILTNGQIKQYDFLQMLGQALQIEELTQLNLQQALADFHIGDGKVWIDQLVLESQNLNLTAQGTIKLDGKMELHARLAVNEKISRRLPNFIAANFHPVENSDLRSLDFEVTGTLAKPRTNIVERMLGTQIQKQAVDLFQSIFGKKKKP